MMSTKEIDPTIKEDIAEFYKIGKTIRDREDQFELPWKDDLSIEEFVTADDVEVKVVICQEGEDLGRVLAFRFGNKPETGYLGWYECDNNDALASQLLTEAEDWLKDIGAKEIFGPMNGSSWGAFRFNMIADKPLFATEPYQPLYYLDQWKNAGFELEVEYETHLVPKDISVPMTLEEVNGLAMMVGVKFSTWPTDLAQNEAKLKDMHEFFHSCFKDNPLYRPISFETYQQVSTKLEEIIDFDHSFLVSDKEGKPVSVLISYRDVYNTLYEEGKLKDEVHNTKTLYMKTICTAPQWRGNHISRVLVNYGFNVAFDNGYKEVVFGTMMKENNSAKYSKSFYTAKPLRTYSFLKKTL